MALETLDDINQILAQCCCEMPECPVPTKECESIQIQRCGHVLPEHPDVTGCDRYTTKTVSYHLEENTTGPNDPPPDDTQTYTVDSTAQIVIDLIRNGEGLPECRTRYGQDRTDTENSHTYSGIELIFSSENVFSSPLGTWVPSGITGEILSNETFTTSYEYPPDPPEVTSGGPEESLVGFTDAAPDETWTFVEPATFTKTESGEYSEFSTWETETTVTYSGEPDDPFEEFAFPDDANGDGCNASLNCDFITKTRFRWVIPDTWAGSYFKISWDVVFFPETGDPSAVLTDQTWEWTGPGDPEDAATWKSGWYEIAPPESAGETRVVNVRFECYRPTAFGIKPQITGEAVDLPDP